MEVQILATGSSGNSVFIDNSILIDAGITIPSFQSFQIKPEDIDALIITHNHPDHVKLPLVRRLLQEGVKAYLPKEVIASIIAEGKMDIEPLLGMEQIIPLQAHQTFCVSDLHVTPHPQKHYDIVNFAFVIEANDERLLYATDLDTLSPSDIGDGLMSLGLFDTILLEGNYDEAYLRSYLEYMISLVPSESSTDVLNDDELDKWVRRQYRNLPKDVAQNAFRAVQNRRHLSKQQARAYVKDHLKQNGRYYEIHRSSQFYEAPSGWYASLEE